MTSNNKPLNEALTRSPENPINYQTSFEDTRMSNEAQEEAKPVASATTRAVPFAGSVASLPTDDTERKSDQSTPNVSMGRMEASSPNKETQGRQREDIADAPADGTLSQVSSTAQSQAEPTDEPSKTTKPTKIEKPNLRKGKWTVEEEEYTSRIIHHFSTGLLALPEGMTLRSYIADKLNCDPMRVTKKYAGASCLGKRAFQFFDRSRHSAAEVAQAKAELSHFEERFRLRVDHGQTGLPLPPMASVLPSFANGRGFNVTSGQNQAATTLAASTWLQNIATLTAAAGVSAQEPSLPDSVASLSGQVASAFGAKTIAPNVPLAPAGGPADQLAALGAAGANELLIKLALAQAAVSLSPALSQLAAGGLQQQQQQLKMAILAQIQANIQKEQLRQAFEAQMQQTADQGKAAPTPAPSTAATYSKQAAPSHQTSTLKQVAAPESKTAVDKQPVLRDRPPPSPTRSKEDEDAGSVLFGFISSLRQSFEEAKARRQGEESRQMKVETASGTTGTTNPATDSSLDELSENDKKGSTSGSEESDEAATGVRSRLGPPRKRHKSSQFSEFTRRNIAEHNTRMEALHEEEKRKSARAPSK